MPSKSFSPYDPQNVFAKILRGELPCKKIKETPHSLAFYDLYPQASVHALLIPKGLYGGSQEFFQKSSGEELEDFCRLLGELPDLLGISGAYILKNHEGKQAGQEIPHFHMHLLSVT